MIICLIFFLFLQTKPSFFRLFAWFQLNFSVIPVSISAVSLTGRQTWQNVNSKWRLQRIQNVQEEKRHQKKETTSCFCLFSFCFWGEISNSWILNDIGRNFLLGSRKKIAKCLMPPYLSQWSTWNHAEPVTNREVISGLGSFFRKEARRVIEWNREIKTADQWGTDLVIRKTADDGRIT
jgi:hypothetical protein